MSSQKIFEQLKSGQLDGVKRLDLAFGLTEFPREIFELADSLEILNLSGNNLSSLPDDLPRLHKLRILFCSDNLFSELPEVLGKCKKLTMIGFKANQISHVPFEAIAPTLRWLILTDNRIRRLPSSIGQCKQMQKLMLAGNQLSDLPVELANCSRLELLRLSANCFSVLPAWLLTMPSLAWLAIAGNQLNDSFESVRENHSIADIDWQDIELGEKLGEGASGVIYKAKLRQTDTSTKEVAVKLFRSDVTSDGMPHSEMVTSIAVGLHPNIVSVLGKISCHPKDVKGLVMSLISSDFTDLAQPPSLDSCTRDIYTKDLTLNLQELCSLAHDIAKAVEHLHNRGILHGDLYAHNILYDANGHGLLGDFGASSFLPTNDAYKAQSFQRIEVRAFGILLGELLALYSERFAVPEVAECTSMSKLSELQERCVQTDVSARPLFSDVVKALNFHIDVANSVS
jgi:hypothetical protein